MNTGGCWAFGGRKNQHDGIFFPGPPTGLVCQATPDIHHQLPFLIKGTGGSNFSMLPEVFGKGLCHWLKATGHPASYTAAFKWNIDRLQNLSPGVFAGLSTAD